MDKKLINHQNYLKHQDAYKLTYKLLNEMHIKTFIYKRIPKVFNYIHKFASYYIKNNLTLTLNDYANIINNNLLRDMDKGFYNNGFKLTNIKIDLDYVYEN